MIIHNCQVSRWYGTRNQELTVTSMLHELVRCKRPYKFHRTTGPRVRQEDQQRSWDQRVRGSEELRQSFPTIDWRCILYIIQPKFYPELCMGSAIHIQIKSTVFISGDILDQAFLRAATNCVRFWSIQIIRDSLCYRSASSHTGQI